MCAQNNRIWFPRAKLSPVSETWHRILDAEGNITSPLCYRITAGPSQRNFLKLKNVPFSSPFILPRTHKHPYSHLLSAWQKIPMSWKGCPGGKPFLQTLSSLWFVLGTKPASLSSAIYSKLFFLPCHGLYIFFIFLLYAICMQVTHAKLPFQLSWQRIYHHSDSIFHRSWTLKGNLWKYSTSVRPALPRRTLSSLINMINFPVSQQLLVFQPLICSNFSCVSLAQVCLY